jgi:type III secretion protein Q
MAMLTRTAPLNLPPAAFAPARQVHTGDEWLPMIPAGDIATMNALYRHRRAIEALVAGHTVTIETAAQVSFDRNALAFRLAMSGRPGRLRLSRGLVDLCARSLAMQRFPQLDGVRAGILLELALLRSIKVFETRLKTAIRIEEQVDAAELDETLLPLRLAVRGLPGGDAAIELLLDRQTAGLVAQALDDFAAPNAHVAQLPIPIRICRDRVDLTVAELRALRPGDIVLADGDPLQPHGPVAVVSDRLQFRAEPVEHGFRLGARLIGSDANSAGDWFMPQPSDAPERAALEDAALDQLPIRVVFELGRLDVPLTEVRRLAPGYVLPLAKPSDSAVDLVANGRRIGHGSLVKIGDSVGVRVERLMSDD